MDRDLLEVGGPVDLLEAGEADARFADDEQREGG
jgi:hypothetical protein